MLTGVRGAERHARSAATMQTYIGQRTKLGPAAAAWGRPASKYGDPHRRSEDPCCLGLLGCDGYPVIVVGKPIHAFQPRKEPIRVAGAFIYCLATAFASALSAAFVRRVSRAARSSIRHICCALSFGRQLCAAGEPGG
jgi:hypothetical protein